MHLAVGGLILFLCHPDSPSAPSDEACFQPAGGSLSGVEACRRAAWHPACIRPKKLQSLVDVWTGVSVSSAPHWCKLDIVQHRLGSP